MSAPAAIGILCLLGALPDVGAAADLALPPPGGSAWRPLRFPRIERASVYETVREEGLAAVRAESRCSASGLVLPLEHVDLDRTPVLRWKWKVEKPLPARSERARSGDDFAARVYVLFRFEPSRASLWERLQHRVAGRLYGESVPGDALNYVWSSGEERGETWRNPFTDRSWMVSLGRGPLPSWRDEDVDVAADYRAGFGVDPPPVVGIGLMTDSDNLCGEAVAYYAEFRFVEPEGTSAGIDGGAGTAQPGKLP